MGSVDLSRRVGADEGLYEGGGADGDVVPGVEGGA